MSTMIEQLANVAYTGKPRRVAKNTVQYTRPDGATCWRFHETDVVTLYEGVYTLNSGGWRTRTTQARMTAFSPIACICQRQGVWYVNHGATIPYADGIRITKDGKVLNPPKAKTVDTLLAQKREIYKFVDLIDSTETLPMPSPGDCWICMIHAHAIRGGEKLSDDLYCTCLWQHVREGYLHGTLIVNAMRFAGWRDEQIGFHLRFGPGDRGTVKRAVRKYLCHVLKIGITTR